MTFSDWLLQEIEKSGLSYSEIGRRGGVSHARISQVINGEKPGISFCVAIARGLGKPIDDVLRLAGHLPPKSDDGKPDVATDEIALANVLRKERGKRELTADDFERDFFDSDDPMLQDFKRIWDILSYNERQELIYMAEDLKRKRKDELAGEGAAGEVTIGHTAEGVA